MIICLENGKRYIGATRSTFGRRITNHRYHLNKNMHVNNSLQSDFKLYGMNAFCWVVLDKDFRREQFWMDEIGPEYNVCMFAGTTLGFKHPPKTQLQLDAHRKARLGAKNGMKQRAAAAESNRKRIWSQESRLKASESAKRRWAKDVQR